MRAQWIKIILFVLGVFALAQIASVLLDPGLGVPDETRRSKHPAGFSLALPRGWSALMAEPTGPEEPDVMRVTPDRSTGRQPTLSISQLHGPPRREGEESAVTFQGQPAIRTVRKRTRDWLWRLDFQREGAAYCVILIYPVQTDVEHSALWPFIESFRVERVLKLAPTTIPTTLPVPSFGTPEEG